MIHTTSLALAVTLLLAACSAVPGTNPTATRDPGTEATPVAPDGGATTNPDDPLGFGDEANTAVVTIGDQRYEFGNLYCVTIGGALGAVSVGGDPQVDIDIPPMDWETSADGWDPPSVQVNLEDMNWIASPEDTALPNIEPGLSQVDSFNTDGYHATGTATFMDSSAWQGFQFGLQDEQPEPVQGTFEVTCPQ